MARRARSRRSFGRNASGGSWRSKFNGQLTEVRIDGHKVALLKPETYMNESGRSIQAAAKFFKVDPDAVLVVHDEGDFDLGRLQARLGGGLAGHNGLRSIAGALGTQDAGDLRPLRHRQRIGPECRRRQAGRAPEPETSDRKTVERDS